MSESSSASTATNESTDIDVNAQERDAKLACSAGELLKREREAAGLHIGALAVLLKVPVKKLEALESGRFDLLPDVVFARALAASVCRTLKIDVATVLELFPNSLAPKLGQQAVRAAPAFHAAAAGAVRPGAGRKVSRTALLAGAVLLAAALVLVFLPAIKNMIGSVSPVSVNSPSVIFLPDSNTGAAGSTVTNDSLTTFGPITAVPQGTVETPALAASGPSIAAVSAPALAAVAPAAPAPAIAATSPLVLTAKLVSWAQVTDAGGQVLLRRNLAVGEVLSFTGALPLSVVIGRADAIEVQLRGKPFDLSSVARENVARFEVK
jgi:cytoskeleton protein RodZ